MPTDQRHATDFFARLRAEMEPDELRRRLGPNHGPSRPKVPSGAEITPEALNQRWEIAGGPPEVRQALMDPQTQFLMAAYQRNIENFIGTVKVPVGLAGPLRVNGLFAQGDYYIPLATTEAALVASHNRGAQLITEAGGGCTAVLVDEGISRAPGFAFGNLLQAGEFVVWMLAHMDEVREVGQSTTRFGKMVDMRITIEGNHVYLNFEFITGDASGQNMVTIATDAICKFVAEQPQAA